MGWYNNSQGAVVVGGEPDVTVPESGDYIFTYLDIPHSGDEPIMLSSDFTVSVANDGVNILDVWAQIGVSNPSETDYPLRPFVGVLHSVTRARILPGGMSVLHVIRLDVIDPVLLDTYFPWELSPGVDGGYPRLAPQVFGPAGTKLCNCAARVVQII